MTQTRHIPVLMHEAIAGLHINSGEIVVDATLGGGGYTRELHRIVGDTGTVVAIDRDMHAIEKFRATYPEIASQIILIHGNFAQLPQLLAQHQISHVNGIVADLGISSDQLDDANRGLSFLADGPLDMRLDQSETITAQDIVNDFTEEQLRKIFWQYGDEKFSRQIAHVIVQYRTNAQITTTHQLVEIILSAIPQKFHHTKTHPATRVFQALRMVVNHEQDDLQAFLDATSDLLVIGGRLSVVTFHSGEDAMVKRFMRAQARGCVCPASFPVCQCHRTATMKIITRQPIVPRDEEIAQNPRSRSAHLRIAQRIA